MPTEGLIKAYMPTLTKVLEDNPNYKQETTAPDGHSYGFPYIEQMFGLVLTPGPLLFQNQADVVYGIFAAMLVCSVIMLFMEFFGLRVFIKLLSIPKYMLLPCVFVLCVIGAYALKNNMSQVIACLIFGAIGFAFKKFEVPTTPFILGFILGPLAEVNYRRGMMRSQGDFMPFLTSPISAVFLTIAVLIVVMYLLKPVLAKRKKQKAD